MFFVFVDVQIDCSDCDVADTFRNEVMYLYVGGNGASVTLPAGEPHVPSEGPVPDEVKQQMVDYVLKLSELDQLVAVWQNWRRRW